MAGILTPHRQTFGCAALLWNWTASSRVFRFKRTGGRVPVWLVATEILSRGVRMFPGEQPRHEGSMMMRPRSQSCTGQEQEKEMEANKRKVIEQADLADANLEKVTGGATIPVKRIEPKSPQPRVYSA